MVKRLFDILLSLVAILFLAVPMLLIAAIVRLGSRGPAVFRQKRVGLGGKPFSLLKFRTMHAEVDPYGHSPHSRADARLTRFGRFLRETSLDELPQLFNVLAGQMSLVGPRPLYQRQAERWSQRQRRRLDVRPGLSGYAQVYGRGDMTHEEKIELDLHYVENQGFLLDARIVLRTIANLLARGGRDVYEQQYSRSEEYEEAEGPVFVFDLDDTLYPERQYVRSGYRAAAEHVRKAFGRDGPFEQWLWERFLGGASKGAFDALSEQFALDLTEAQISELVEVYRSHEPDIRPYEGLAEVLSALRARGRLALLTDGFLPAQELKFRALGLEDLFEVVVFTERLGQDCRKPAPGGFEAVRRMLGAANEACTYVGDNLAKDFQAPNRLGWRTVRLCRPGQIHAAKPAPPDGDPGATVHSPAELLDELT